MSERREHFRRMGKIKNKHMLWKKIASLMRKRPNQTWVGRQETQKANTALGVGKRHPAPLILVIPGRSVTLPRLRFALVLRSLRRQKVVVAFWASAWWCRDLFIRTPAHPVFFYFFISHLFVYLFPVSSLCNNRGAYSCHELCPVFRSTNYTCK